jgi:3-hydroxyacyl-CoA dehydrogenase / enoyl-CoA hydratase / 3-hydroxybutyryl-CoA epimerase
MIKYKKDTNNIVTLTLDMAGRKVNIINHEIGNAFFPVLEHLKEEKAKGALRGVILTSGKKSFLAGGDLDYIFKNENVEEIFDFSQALKRFFRDLESPGVPVVAALNGTALGTGFEMAMACHHRIVIKKPTIQLGHPEASLGIMPGSGGVIRLMWLLGIERAFQILAKGQSYNPEEALKAGIVDELADDVEDMIEKANNWLMKTQEGRRPWDKEGEKIPKGTAHDLKIANKIRFLGAQLTKKNYNNYPAPQAILNTLSEGSKVNFDTACRIESRYFTKLMLSREAKNMCKVFWYDFNTIKAGDNRPKGFGKFRPKKVGIVGAGLMGSGIAYSCIQHGMDVVLKDVSKAIADRGKEYTEQKLADLVADQKLSEKEKSKFLKKITTTEHSEDFESCDLVIESVFENQMVKSKVTKEAEMHMDEYAFLATNTVSIPINKLAKSANRPENYIGLHFFAPVETVPLVEIVKGEKTSDETVARAFDFVKKIRKIPIIVKDSWGFYASRVLNTYILEGLILLQEGYAPALIENLGLQAGMPKGSLAFADDLSMKMMLSYENQAATNYGPKYIQHPAVDVLHKMIEEIGRQGKSQKAGFYNYGNGENRRLWNGLKDYFPPLKTDYDKEEIIERFMFAQVIEAVWCLQEKIIQSVPEANLGSIYGWGFPAFKGGVLQYINDYGIVAFVERCELFEKTHGPRFKVPKLLKEKSERNEVF